METPSTPQEQLAAARAIFSNPAIELSPSAAQQRHQAGSIQLIDVREPHEWEAGHVPGARHLEIERLAWNAPSIDRARDVCFYCRLGIRGSLVAHAFRAVGYTAFTITGGFSAWAADGLPIDPPDGTVSEH